MLLHPNQSALIPYVIEQSPRGERSYDLIAMPVVDENGRMLGIVTVDDAMEVIEDSAEETTNKRTWVAVVVALLCFLIFLVPYTVIILHFFGGAAG